MRLTSWPLLAVCIAAFAACGDSETSGTTDDVVADTGTTDTGATDTSVGDTGAGDTGSVDTSTGDTGTSDTGTGDTLVSDADATDTGAADTGTDDTGVGDTSDAGDADTGATDAGGGDTGAGDTGAGDTDVVFVPMGDDCDTAIDVTVPSPFDAEIVITGDTTGLLDDYGVDGLSCSALGADLGAGTVDRVYAFTAPTAGAYRVNLRGTDVDTALYVLTSCVDPDAAGACLASSDVAADDLSGSEELWLELAADDSVFLVVETAVEGAFTLTIAPPVATDGAGNSCATATALPAGAFPKTLQTSISGTGTYTLKSCFDEASGFGANHRDYAAVFTADTPGTYPITVTSTGVATADHFLMAFTSGDCDVDSCFGAADDDDGVTGVESFNVTVLTAPTDIYVVIDGFDHDAPVTSFELVVGAPSALSDGNSCAEAASLTQDMNAAIPTWTGAGDLSTGLTDTIDATACGQTTFNGAGVPDQVWSFTVPTGGGDFLVTVTPEDDEDFMIYAFDDSACTMCGPTGPMTTPWFIDTDVFGGLPELLPLDGLTGETTVQIVVDSFSTVKAGAYTIEVAQVCTCAPDSCNVMDSCGIATCECSGGATCNTGTNLCEAAAVGDTCAVATVLAGPTIVDGFETFSGAGDTSTSGLTDAHQTGSCEKLGSLTATGPATDQAFTFTAANTGNYRVTVAPGANTDTFITAYTSDACDGGATCIGYEDTAGGELPDDLLLMTTAGAQYWIVVDSWNVNATGTYTIEVAQECAPACAAGACNVDDGCGGTCACTAVNEVCGDANQCVPTPGNTCAEAFTLTLDAAPAQTGDLNGPGLTSDFAAGVSCNENDFYGDSGLAAVDQVWSFTAPADDDYLFTVTPSGGADTFLYALPAANCADLNNCIATYDEGGDNAPDSITVTLNKDEAISIVVDSWDADSVGAYTITATNAP